MMQHHSGEMDRLFFRGMRFSDLLLPLGGHLSLFEELFISSGWDSVIVFDNNWTSSRICKDGEEGRVSECLAREFVVPHRQSDEGLIEVNMEDSS